MTAKTTNRGGGQDAGKPPGRGLASRRLAVEVLVQVEKEGAYANLALAAAFRRKRLTERDRAFVTALVQGVLRHRAALDERLSRVSKHSLADMPATLRNLLRLGVFQIEEMKDIPAAAVVDTCCQLARATGHKGLVKFTNAVLRTYLRQHPCVEEAVVAIDDARQLATLHSMPLWLVERWLERFGREETQALLKCAQEIPDLVLRTCQLAITTEGLKSLLEQKGIKCRQGRLVKSCLVVVDRGKFRGPVRKLPGFDEGLFTVQDEPAAFVSVVVSPQPGELIIDLCAAPGGKSLHLAELMENKGRVVAVDSHAGRLNLLRENRQRLGLTNIETVVADARSFVCDRPADRVLVDAPCTGTGVINRRSDLRYNREPPDLEQLVRLQRELLAHARTLLKPGGVLVYSTCSIEPEENEDNIRWLAESFDDMVPESITPFIPADLLSEWRAQGGEAFAPDRGVLELLPSRHGMSGFFISRLRRRE